MAAKPSASRVTSRQAKTALNLGAVRILTYHLHPHPAECINSIQIIRQTGTRLIPKLQVTSRFLRSQSIANPWPSEPLVYARAGRGFFGSGIALIHSAKGPNRFEELSDFWQQVVSQAAVDDQVGLPGSGLMSFASLAFSDHSEIESVLVVPRRVLVVQEDRAWVTEISADASTPTNPAAPSREASDWWLQQLSAEQLATPTLDLKIGSQTRGGFMAAVQDAVDRIRSGVVSKVVLARDLTAELPADFDLRPVLAKLSDDYQKCWVYSVAGNFGASPELLIRSAQGEVSARVLAGTAGRGTDPDVDRAIADGLAHSAKNRGEHRLAVESLVRSLEPFCEIVEADPQPFSLQLPDVWHLATDVRGRLSGRVDLLRVLAELHPTAAVAGTPRDRALQLIDELEPFDRGFYAGPVGWISADGSGEFVIALRGAQIQNGRLRALAGCGIVAESDPKAELQETELKFAAIRSAVEG